MNRNNPMKPGTLILALVLLSLLHGCATPTVRQKDLDAWVNQPADLLETHPFFTTLPMEKKYTETGVEIRSYINEVANFGACNSVFRIKNGRVLEYAPTASGRVRCFTDDRVLPSAIPVVAREISPEPAPRELSPPDPALEKMASTGTGFIVSPQGHVLTNQHVIGGCREVSVAGAGKVMQLAADDEIDLALLKLSPGKRGAATFRGGQGVRTGEDIIVAGYPLQGLLSSELNVTKGTLSSISGPGEDRRIIQITAPVQQGNSGGPVLDTSGNIVGVVRSKLNAIKFARATGVLPENINFAVSEGTARAFLDKHNVPYNTARSDKTLPTADIAAQATGYTVLIECWN